MAKKAASPKTSKAKENKSRNDSSAKDANNADEETTTTTTTNDEEMLKAAASSETTASPTKEIKKRKAEPEEEDKAAKEDDDAAQGEEGATNDDNEDGKPAAKLDIDLTKPIKKARTAYFIFGDEKRAEIQAKVSKFWFFGITGIFMNIYIIIAQRVPDCQFSTYNSTKVKEWLPWHENWVKCGPKCRPMKNWFIRKRPPSNERK